MHNRCMFVAVLSGLSLFFSLQANSDSHYLKDQGFNFEYVVG